MLNFSQLFRTTLFWKRKKENKLSPILNYGKWIRVENNQKPIFVIEEMNDYQMALQATSETDFNEFAQANRRDFTSKGLYAALLGLLYSLDDNKKLTSNMLCEISEYFYSRELNFEQLIRYLTRRANWDFPLNFHETKRIVRCLLAISRNTPVENDKILYAYYKLQGLKKLNS